MMDFRLNLPLFCIILSLLCSAISSVLKGRAARRLTLCLLAASLAAEIVLLLYLVKNPGVYFYKMGHFPAPWGNEIRITLLEPLVMTFICVTYILCVLGGKAALNREVEESKTNLYYVMICLSLSSLTALTYTNDVFTSFVFIEICMLSSCGILVVRRKGETIVAATRYMIFCLLGSGLFLFGLVFLYQLTGHLLMPNIKEAIAELYAMGQYRIPLLVTITFITVGLAVKSGMFPFHYWMPDTYGYALPGSNGILSGVVSKAYVILLIKMIYNVFGTDVFYGIGADRIMFWMGAVGMIVGSVSAIRERDVNRMIAYSSAAQLGYIYLGIGISPTLGVLAALFHIFTHCMTKPLLFLASSGLSAASGWSRDMRDFYGAGRRNRAAGAAFTVGALSMVGIPLFMGFVSKMIFAEAGISSDRSMLPTLIVLAISTILNAVYFLRIVLRIYMENKNHNDEELIKERNKPSLNIALAVYSVINIFLGVCSQPIVELLRSGLSLLG